MADRSYQSRCGSVGASSSRITAQGQEPTTNPSSKGDAITLTAASTDQLTTPQLSSAKQLAQVNERAILIKSARNLAGQLTKNSSDNSGYVRDEQIGHSNQSESERIVMILDRWAAERGLLDESGCPPVDKRHQGEWQMRSCQARWNPMLEAAFLLCKNPQAQPATSGRDAIQSPESPLASASLASAKSAGEHRDCIDQEQIGSPNASKNQSYPLDGSVDLQLTNNAQSASSPQFEIEVEWNEPSLILERVSRLGILSGVITSRLEAARSSLVKRIKAHRDNLEILVTERNTVNSNLNDSHQWPKSSGCDQQLGSQSGLEESKSEDRPKSEACDRFDTSSICSSLKSTNEKIKPEDELLSLSAQTCADEAPRLCNLSIVSAKSDSKGTILEQAKHAITRSYASNNIANILSRAKTVCKSNSYCGSCIKNSRNNMSTGRFPADNKNKMDKAKFRQSSCHQGSRQNRPMKESTRSTCESSLGKTTEIPCEPSPSLNNFLHCTCAKSFSQIECPVHTSSKFQILAMSMKNTNKSAFTPPPEATTEEECQTPHRDNLELDVEQAKRKNRSGSCSPRKRENWDKKIEFLLAVIGFAVDLGNVWRFPYICYKNGGGAFLIPYTVMFILGGLPIFYLELSLGQYFSSGCLTVWRRVCPMAKGIGYAMCVLNFFTGLYYNTVISWAVFFFVQSFTNTLPWTSCNNTWNSKDCKTIEQRINSSISKQDFFKSSDATNLSFAEETRFSRPTTDYFEREVLQLNLSTGIDDLGSIRWPLAIYLAIVFICIYFAIWKGVKSTGKAVWITALLPYFVLIPLLIRGIFLEGAWLGISYYLSPQWSKIMDYDVWVEAAKQIYFSLGPGFGTLMALSSYNKFNHNCRKDALIAATVNYFASFIAGLVIFAVLGYMATLEKVSINTVVTDGPGLVFQVYPEGLATMRYSSMWSVLFFIMVVTLGIDSTFGGLESVITGLCDEYPKTLRAHRGLFIGLLIILIYFCSLPTTTYGGNYVIGLLESYGTSLSLLFIVLVETIIVCWLYGADRFCDNLREMYGETPGPYWRICWKYVSPTILLLIFVAACRQELEKYHVLSIGSYTYPSWSPTVGLLMTGSSVCCIPIYAIYYIKTKTSGDFIERLKLACKPIDLDRKIEDEIYISTNQNKIRDEIDTHVDTVI